MVVSVAVQLVVGHTAARGPGIGVQEEVVSVRILRVDLVDVRLIVAIEGIAVLVIETTISVW